MLCQHGPALAPPPAPPPFHLNREGLLHSCTFGGMYAQTWSPAQTDPPHRVCMHGELSLLTVLCCMSAG